MQIKNEIQSFLLNLKLSEPIKTSPSTVLPEQIALDDEEFALTEGLPYVQVLTVKAIPKFSDRGDDVLKMQAQINIVGRALVKIKEDGIYKLETKNAISKIQKAAGMPGSGDMGPLTMALLNLKVQTDQVISPIPYHSVDSKRRFSHSLCDVISKELQRTDPVSFKRALDSKNATELMAMAAGSFVSMRVRERTNRNDGVIVELMQKVCFGDVGEAWCLYLQQSAIMFAEAMTGVTSPTYSTGSCASLRSHTPKFQQVEMSRAERGDMVVFVYKTDGTGHVGTFVKWVTPGVSAVLYEGNTTQGLVNGAVVREGNGAYETNRNLVTPAMKVAMIVRPFPKV